MIEWHDNDVCRVGADPPVERHSNLLAWHPTLQEAFRLPRLVLPALLHHPQVERCNRLRGRSAAENPEIRPLRRRGRKHRIFRGPTAPEPVTALHLRMVKESGKD